MRVGATSSDSSDQTEASPKAVDVLSQAEAFALGLLQGLVLGTVFSALVLSAAFSARHWLGTDTAEAPGVVLPE
jgi:hypothetical protein